MTYHIYFIYSISQKVDSKQVEDKKKWKKNQKIEILGFCMLLTMALYPDPRTLGMASHICKCQQWCIIWQLFHARFVNIYSHILSE